MNTTNIFSQSGKYIGQVRSIFENFPGEQDRFEAYDKNGNFLTTRSTKQAAIQMVRGWFRYKK